MGSDAGPPISRKHSPGRNSSPTSPSPTAITSVGSLPSGPAEPRREQVVKRPEEGSAAATLHARPRRAGRHRPRLHGAPVAPAPPRRAGAEEAAARESGRPSAGRRPAPDACCALDRPGHLGQLAAQAYHVSRARPARCSLPYISRVNVAATAGQVVARDARALRLDACHRIAGEVTRDVGRLIATGRRRVAGIVHQPVLAAAGGVGEHQHHQRRGRSSPSDKAGLWACFGSGAARFLSPAA